MGWVIMSEKTESVEDKNPDTYVKRAENQLSKRNIQEAIKEINVAITYCEPKKRPHYEYEKAKILFAADHNAECVNLMLQQIKYFYNFFESTKFVKVIELLIKAGNYSNNEIKAILSEKSIPTVAVDTNHPNLEQYFLTRANQEQGKNRIANSIKAIEVAITYCDNKKDMHYVLNEKVKILCYAKRFNECNQLIQEHLVDFYYNLNVYNFRDLLAILIKTKDDSKTDVKNILISQNIPWVLLNEMGSKILSYDYLKNKSDEYAQSENYEVALQYCELCIKVQPNHSHPFILQGYCYYKTEKYDESLSCYDKALKQFPEIIQQVIVKGENGYFEKGLADFEKFVISNSRVKSNFYKDSILNPEIRFYLNNKSRVLIVLNRFTEAENCLVSAIKLGKNKTNPDAEANYILGNLYDITNRFISAHYSYKRASSINEKYTIPLNKKRKKKLLYFRLLIVLCLSAITVGTIMGYEYYGEMTDGENAEQAMQEIDGVTEAIQKDDPTEKKETIYEHREIIPHETIEQGTDTLPIGESEVVQIGVDGSDLVTYRITYEANGRFESNKEINRENESQPVTEIINIGTSSTAKQIGSRSPDIYSAINENQSGVGTDIQRNDNDLTKLDGIPIHSSNLAFENSLGTYRYIKDNDSTAKHDIQFTLTLFNDDTYVLTSTHLDNFIDNYSNSFPGEITIGYTSGFVVDGNFEVSTKMAVEFSSVDNYLNKIQSKITQKINGNYYEDGILIQGYLQSLNDMITIIEANEDTITLNYGGMNRITLLRVPDEYQYGFKEIIKEYDGVYQ